MSRTLKDRPYWVKTNDKNLDRVEYHNHEEAGKAIKVMKPVTDENGEFVWETIRREVLLGYRFYRPYEGYIMFATRHEAQAYIQSSSTAFLDARYYAVYGEKDIRRVKNELVIIGYRPDECTIDKPRNCEASWKLRNTTEYLCWKDVETRDGGCPCCHHRPMKSVRKRYHAGARQTETSALRNIVKLANDGFDFDDDNYENAVLTRQKQHSRSW